MDCDRSAVHPILGKDGSDLLCIDLCKRDGVGDGDLHLSVRDLYAGFWFDTHSSALFPPDSDSRGFLVQPNTEAFELIGKDSQVIKRLEHIEDDEDQITGPSDSYDLSSSTLPVFRSFYDS